MGVWGLPLENCFETTPYKTSEKRPLAEYIALMLIVDLQSSKEKLIPQTDSLKFEDLKQKRKGLHQS